MPILQLRRFRPDLRSVVLFALFCLALDTMASQPVHKSPHDPREYQAVVLDNGLRVLLVSDPQTDKAAASLNVDVGSRADPPGREGLSHFLEHMLFLGTEAYPAADEYQAFISSHGGSHNAYTAFEDTNYFFDVDAEHLPAALDRFSQFFIAPLFTPRYVERELKAVDSEYQSKLEDDGRHVLQAWLTLVNPAHPLSRYFGGNAESLAADEARLREELIEFWRVHYAAERMSLAVLGRQSLAELEQLARERFSAIAPRASGDVPRAEVPAALFLPGALPARVDVAAVKDRRILSLMFPVPPARSHWREKPDWYIANLLGHEGPGSLLSAFKARGWADGLSSGPASEYRDAAMFHVTVALTEQGLGHIDAMVQAVFDYVALIEASGLEQWIFDENQRLAEIDFLFRSPSPPRSTVTAVSPLMDHLPLPEVLRGAAIIESFSPPLIREYLSHLRPDNLLLLVNARDLPTDRETRWFGARYSVRAIAPEVLADWRAADGPSLPLALPAANEFIPEELATKPLQDWTAKPEMVLSRDGFALWHQQDATWRLPRADFYFSVRSPQANSTPREAVLTDLFVAVVNDELTEFSYPASLAGLDYSLYRHVRGFSVRMSGFGNKQPVLLQRIVEHLRSPQIDAQRFGAARSELRRRLQNALMDKPYVRAMGEITHLLLEPGWSQESLLDALETITPDDLQAFVPRLLERVSVVTLAHGNLHEADAIELAEVLQATLLNAVGIADVPRASVVRLEPGAPYMRPIEVTQDDSAAVVYLQGESRDFDQRARYGLLAQMLSAPFFSDLRTERQLGYVVFVSPVPLVEVPGIAFVAQSPIVDAVALEQEIAGFLQRYHEQLPSVSLADFERERAALLLQVREEDTNLGDRSSRYWRELDREQYDFDTRERMVEAIEALTLEDFRDFYARAVAGPATRSLAVLAQREEVEAKGRRVIDVGAFKADHSSFTALAPAAISHGQGTAAAPDDDSGADAGTASQQVQ